MTDPNQPSEQVATVANALRDVFLMLEETALAYADVAVTALSVAAPSGRVCVRGDDLTVIVDEAEPRGMHTNGAQHARLTLAIRRVRAALKGAES